MSNSVLTLIVGLGAAMIGASAALGGQWLANRHESETERRREFVTRVAGFWSAVDRWWFAQGGARGWEALQRLAKQNENFEYADECGDHATAYLVDVRAAAADARLLMAQIRLLHPSLVVCAQALLDESSEFDPSDEKESARQRAVEAYEIGARKLLDSASSLRQVRRTQWPPHRPRRVTVWHRRRWTD